MQKATVHVTARETGLRPKTLATAFSDRDSWRENDLVCVEEDFQYQTVRGFGGAITEAAAVTWRKLPAAQRRKAVELCFDPAKGLGYTLARVHMNSCDFSLGNWSCDDTPGDTALKDFSVAHYREAVFPMLDAAQKAAGGRLWLLASPWSPPAWMKTTGRMNEGGSLRPECREAWALFFAKFAKAMAREGFPLSAFTVQNEEKAKQTWDSCVWTAEETRDFVRDHLGPALDRAGLGRLGLYFWDHNKERTLERARVLLSDPAAAAFAAGIAVHWYSGDHFEQLRMFKERWPDKDVLFSECCCGIHERTESDLWRQGELYAHDILGNLENGMTRWIDWNVLLDAQGGPNHVGNFCNAPLRADEAGRTVVVQPSWRFISHFSRFLRPGAVRLGCSRWSADVEAVAARNRDGSFAAVLLNRTDRALHPHLRFRGRFAPVDLPPHSIATVVW
ncbi:MAG: glucosylceramidase [Kiritimatiellae bacterium]|nr:glucosylceramidase [Kiritimatiellia bacterium]